MTSVRIQRSADRSQSLERKQVRLLSPAQELEFVQQLGRQRAKIDRILAPIVAKADSQKVRLDHFDQRLHYVLTLDPPPRSVLKKLKKPLGEYSRWKHELVIANLPWVTKLARSHRQSAISEEDLFQEGVCGLLKAIDRFDAERGLRLMTYATWYIREAMQQLRARQSYTVALSSHDQTLLGQIEAKRTSFQHKNERQPTIKELSDTIPRNRKTLARLAVVCSPTISLDRTENDGSIPVAINDPTGEYDHHEETGSAVNRLLQMLPSRERLVVTRRFGLEGHEPTSLEALGGYLNVSLERVRQLQRQAIRRMQQRADAEGFDFARA